MPEATIHAMRDHGDDHRRHDHDRTTSRRSRCSTQLADVGIDYDDVVQVLEDEGVEKFDASWTELIDSIQEQLDKLAKEVNTKGPAAGSKK